MSADQPTELVDCRECGGTGKVRLPIPYQGPRIFIEMRMYPITAGQKMTGAELRKMHFGFPATDKFWLERPGIGGDTLVEPETEIALQDRMMFYFTPPGLAG